MRACPACHQPLHQIETQAYDDANSATHCSHCGLDLSGSEATSAYLQTSSRAASRIANFSLVRMLGQGAFGAVWLAEDRNLGRQVALKLPKTTGKDAKLLHEAQTAARLKHPNIVSIYEVGVDEGQVFIASEYIDGEDLRNELAKGRPDISRAVKVISTLARTVHHAHQHGIVHRDLKPANIILNSDGEPFITDFGIAKHLAVDETISTDGEVVGTVSYMSPEQARGSTRETDSRSDIYALGVMLFEMLTEYRPFRGNARAVIHQKIYDDAPSPRKLVPALDKDLETICLKCLEREPAKRYPSALEVAEELDRFQNNIPIKARPISRGEKAWRWCRRKPAAAALVAGFFLSLTIGLLGTSYFWYQAAQSEAKTRASLYRTHMNLADKLWYAGDIGGLRQTLAHYEDDAAFRNIRSFEWQYYTQLVEPFLQAVNHGEVVTDVAVSYDGRLFASTGNDRLIRIWNCETGQLVRTLQPQAGKAGAIMFSPVDDRLVSAHGDGTVRLWNPQQHDRTIREFEHGAGLTHVSFSPDGRFLVSAGSNGAIFLWKPGTGEQLANLSQPKKSVRDIRFSPDNHFLAVAFSGGGIFIWDRRAETWSQPIASGADVLSLAFVDDGHTLVAGNYGGTLRYFAVPSGDLLDTVGVDGGAVGDLEFLPAVERLAVVTTAHRLHLLDTHHRSVKSLATHALTHGMLARSQDSSTLIVGSGDGTVKSLRVSALKRPDVFWQETHVRGLEFVAGGRHLASCSGDGTVDLWDVETGEKVELAAPSGREMLALAAQPDGRLLAAAGMSREILILDIESHAVVASIALPYSGYASLAFSSDGMLLAAGSRSGELRVYEAGRWEEPRWTISESDVQVTDVAFVSKDRVAIAYSNGIVKRVDASPGESSSVSIRFESSPFALSYCRARDVLGVGMQSGEIQFFDAATLRPVEIIKAHSSRINAIAWLPNGNRLVSGGRDRELRIWDTESGDLVAALAGHARQVFAVAISPDGRTIASGGLGGDVRIWRSGP